MTAFEIVLVVIGLIIFSGSFFVTEKITASSDQIKAAIDINEVDKLIKQQINGMQDDIQTLINQTVEDSTDGVKRSMEKLSNEKIMAIHDYSDTVMDSINKNHNEVMFLYGMLNDKNKEIKDTAELITKANKGITKKVSEAQILSEKMDKQISELNKFATNQKESMDRLTKSAETIEVLEEQINKIEQMALQFSKDMNVGMTKENRTNTLSGNSESKSISFDWEQGNNNTETDSELGFDQEDVEAEAILESLFSADSEEVLEEIYGSFTNEKRNIEEDMSNNNNKILEMSKEGLLPREIAKTLGLGVGEVQLVIDLFEGGRR
jgi:hypothetical protein